MPIYKYRSLQQAEAHLQELLPADPLLRLKRLEKLLAGLRPPIVIQRGLFKFRTLEEANQHRQATTG
ncbi:MAG: hypothetical protein ALAOOOJD_02448 [bacterium]|nr:hypothetical protein [bacterium]